MCFAAAICSGAKRGEIGDYARARRSRIFLTNAGDGLACGASGNRSHTPATEWVSKYSAVSWSDRNFGSGGFAGERLFFICSTYLRRLVLGFK